MKKFTKVLCIMLCAVMVMFCFAGCDSEASRASYNISQEADNFNIVRKVTVIDCITGDVLFQMKGRLSITKDNDDNQLEITVEREKDNYEKHFIGLSDNVTYVVEDLGTGNNKVSSYSYELNYNPKMWLPVKPKVVD